MAADNIVIVTKDTFQNYNPGTTVAAVDRILSVTEVDTNFINLKQGIIDLEALVAPKASPTFTGTPAAPTAASGTSTTQIATTAFVTDALTSTKNKVFDSTVGNDALAASIGNFAGLASPAFTGQPTIAAAGYTFSTYNSNVTYVAPVQYVEDKLQNLSNHVTPVANATSDLGGAGTPFRTLYLKGSILPTTSTVDLGSSSNKFRDLYLSGNTLFMGDTQISESNSTLVMPTNTAIGAAANVIPQNIASTDLDAAISGLSVTQKLTETFTASGAITSKDPVALNSNGTVSKITDTTGSEVANTLFIGIAEASVSNGATVSIAIHGPITGLSGLTSGSDLFVTAAGALTHTSSATTVKIGRATGTTTAFIFITTSIDTYLLNKKKTELTDFSITTASASGVGALAYNNATGVFTYTPASLLDYATNTDVSTAIDNLIDSAPGALNTLNELAAAMGDDANFSTTVTNSLATKIGLTNLSVGSDASASGSGGVAYNNSTGVFTYTPPDLSSYITGVAWSAITSKPTTISGFGITDSIAYTNADIDIGSNDFITTGKALYANMYAQTTDLPSAATYHGMFAHVHATGAGYFAHNSVWVRLANYDDAAPKASPALTGTPTAPTASSGTNTTQIATTAFVTAAVAAGGGGVGTFVEKTSAYTAVAGDKLIVDTSSAVTITLPSSATIGDEIKIIDGTGNASTNNITIGRNGHKIQGDAADLTVATARAAFGLVYYNAANGWILMER